MRGEALKNFQELPSKWSRGGDDKEKRGKGKKKSKGVRGPIPIKKRSRRLDK